MRVLLAIAFVLAPAPAAAQLRDGLCHDLRMAIASAAQREPFGSVTDHRNWRQFRLFEQCRPNRLGPVDRVHCSWRLPSSQPIADEMATETARCLSGARRDDAGSPIPLTVNEMRFVLPEVSIYLDQSVAAPGVLGTTAALVVILRESDR